MNQARQNMCRGRLDLAVLFTPSTPNRQNRNQVHWNICAGIRRSTPSSEVVQTEQLRDLFQKRWRIIACIRGNILYCLIYSGVLQSAQFYLFMWLFWRTPSTLEIAKSSPPQNNKQKWLFYFMNEESSSSESDSERLKTGNGLTGTISV